MERDVMEYDVVIVGAGPAGLAAAIRLKQLAAQAGRDVSVAVLEKGSEVGAHILSGAVFDPSGLDRLLPEWREQGAPLTQQVTKERFLFLGPAGGVELPTFVQPAFLKNHGCYIGSLGVLCRWLGAQAEALGVEIYPGFAAADVLFDDQGAVRGVQVGDFGVGREGEPKQGVFTPGILIEAKYTLLAEGVRGSLSKRVIARYELGKDRDPQKYGIGVKELWEVPAGQHEPGLVQHTFGWPLKDADGQGGSWMYHYGERLVSIGFVTHLNYKNPYISPFEEMQRFKLHPLIKPVLEGGKRLGYGARAISEGGWQSVPKLAFPGGALIGCAAGFVNVPRIKGTHNAVKTGMMAAEAAFEALGAGRSRDTLEAYEAAYAGSDVARELKQVRNVKPIWSRFGTLAVIGLGGLDMWTTSLFGGFSLLGTLSHQKTDAEATGKAEEFQPIVYPKPDGVLTFDRLSSVFLSNTNHEEDQPVHLTLRDPTVPIRHNLPEYAEPAQRYCPAAVYEVLYDEAGANPRFQINAQNCVHCKTCDIKDPTQNITWVTPEGGGGPNYTEM
ncbi:MAG: electron transfer flavoprotein-ubiquinone oxidoreductase [Hyphomonadaceae bacterium]|nr:electron transfer flavoprotein-ubiquinone oxidoreductase [Hyphomonadaceae bacterium]